MSGNLDLNQGVTGVDISYGYVYLLREWLTPGEALYLAFKRFPFHFTESVLVTGYSFVEQEQSQNPAVITDFSGNLGLDLRAETGLQWEMMHLVNGGSVATNAPNPEL